ncbi:MAG: NUDIX domain-containing protein [Chloroflexota bacterium]
MRIFLRLLDEAVSLLMLIFKPMRVGVKMLLIKDGNLVLVKHKYGCDWYLPGGGLKKNESVEEGGRREAAEEIGATLGKVRIFGVYSRAGSNKHTVVLICEDFTFTGETDFEIEEIGIFPVDNLPEGVSGATRRRAADYLARETMNGLGRW